MATEFPELGLGHDRLREILSEQVGMAYDFETQAPLDVSLGQWLVLMDRIICVLRTSSVSHVVTFTER